MINCLKKVVEKYINNDDTSVWENVRKAYGIYSYTLFLCISANTIEKITSLKQLIDVAKKYKLETEEILLFLIEVKEVDFFVKDIIDILNAHTIIDVSEIYQEYLSADFIITEDKFQFKDGKKERDILGAYYTQNEFAEEIARKAINDWILMNEKQGHNLKLKIADFSCGGSAFLSAAYKICTEKGIPAEITGYDVDPIAVVISRQKAIVEMVEKKIKIKICLGNPLLIDEKNDCVNKFKNAIEGRYYSMDMGINITDKFDVIIGNPPWEKVRFEEKKFLYHFISEKNIATKLERKKTLKEIKKDNIAFYEKLIDDYNLAKKFIKSNEEYKYSSRGELNTYALFTEKSCNMIRKGGVVSLIVKSSLVKLPVYSVFFKELVNKGFLYELYMFKNRKKIFAIDSREEFSVFYYSKNEKDVFKLALNLDTFKDFERSNKISITYDNLKKINPETGMIPNIKSNNELKFLSELSNKFENFGSVYTDCKYGRLVHLTNHEKYIRRNYIEGYLPIYEGKFIEQFTNKFATFRGMSEKDKYKSKASAHLIENPQGDEYPEARFFINDDYWKKISKNFNKQYIIAWRSLTSATNNRTMIATLMPFVPTCQSIQILQLSNERQMLHVLALFNSTTFDYIVRLKMAGLDLTQTIIKQIPVPSKEAYECIIKYKGVEATISEHIISRLKQLYSDDKNVIGLFSKYHVYEVVDDRKNIIEDINKLIANMYGINNEMQKKIMSSFDRYYKREQMENH